MSEYIITIVPVTEDDVAGPISQTIVRVETQDGKPFIKELTMRGLEGSGLDATRLPHVDFEMLMRAFLPGTAQPVTAPAPRPVDVPEQRPVPRRSTPRSTADATPGTGAAAPSRRRAGVKASHIQKGRAYRRAPEPEELAAAYEETGSIAGLAAHFGVPVHTAQGWISRLRRKNVFSTESS
ncbi:MAG TPA: hypothetical protein VFR67_17950 [Pilimelia sp.]|nr:hypothetical protein [Pilimelia sp.]